MSCKVSESSLVISDPCHNTRYVRIKVSQGRETEQYFCNIAAFSYQETTILSMSFDYLGVNRKYKTLGAINSK